MTTRTDRPGTPFDPASLPHVEAEIGYCEEIAKAVNNVADPSQTVLPITPRRVVIRDARPIREQLDLDREGFVLTDHPSDLVGLRDREALIAGGYLDDHAQLLRHLSGADVVLPFRSHLLVRLPERAPDEHGDATTRPASYAHLDVTERMAGLWTEWMHEDAGVPMRDYRRVVIYQTWRAVSRPPHDYPLALTDGRSVKPDRFVPMENYHGLGGGERFGENRLGTYDPDHEWYYFSEMTADELLVFKAYDTDFGSRQNVLHTGFDNRPNVTDASPRESVEARFVACWI
jgi:hypothetical protein